MLLKRAGQLEEAARQEVAAIAGFTELHGPDDPNVLKTQCNLGHTRAMLGDHEEAIALWSRALSGQREVLGPDHADTLLTQHNLALSTTIHRNVGDGLAMLRENHHLRLKTLGPRHPETVQTRASIAMATFFSGDVDSARDELDSMRWLLDAHPRDLHPRLADIRWQLTSLAEHLSG